MRALLLASILFVLCACQRATQETPGTPLYQPQYATGFAIDSLAPGVTRVTALSPWVAEEGAGVASSLTLVEDGAKWSADGNVLRVKPQRIVAMSSTSVAMMDELDALSRLVGFSGKQYLSNAKVRENNQVADIPRAENMDYEQLVALRPDLVLIYGVDGNSPMENRLAELGIPFFYIGDYNEQHPLGKAEWLVVLAHILGKRDAGIKMFMPITRRYREISAAIPKTRRKPSVMLNAPYSDSWTLPEAGSYMLRLISDAGGDVVFKPRKNAITSVDMEEAYSMLEHADFWLNTGMATSMGDVASMAPKCATAAPFRNAHIYNNNKRVTAGGGNDFYEGAVLHPDDVLADLAQIFNPTLFPDRQTVYYHQLK